MKDRARFSSEVALCEAFIAALPEYWTAYPETAGWDILLVRPGDGFQVGIQAKLRLNAEVLLQACPTRDQLAAGPDCRAVMVPMGLPPSGLLGIAPRLLLTIIEVAEPRAERRMRYRPSLPTHDHRTFGLEYYQDDWHELAPFRRHTLPDYIPDVPAGAKSPLQLTPWKIKVIRLQITMTRRGYAGRADFKHLGLRWDKIAGNPGWLRAGPIVGSWIAGPGFPDFRTIHPANFAAIEADAHTWLPADLRRSEQPQLGLDLRGPS